MRKDRNEKKKKRIIKIFIAVISIILVALIVLKINDHIILGKNKTINLIVNNKNVTSNLKQDLGNFFDKYIYEDKANNQIITTYDDKIGAISLEENKISINGSEKNTFTHAIKKENTIYVPIQELEDVYGIEIKHIENTKVLAIDSISREQKKAIITKNVPVKSSTKFISKTVDRAKKGSYVIVISDENGYARIRTENGKIGYVKSNKLANTVVVREAIQNQKQINEKVNLVWDYYSEFATAPNRNGETMDGVNVVSPAFFHLNKNEKLTENVGQAGKNYIQWAHENGYKVWPMVQNAGDGMIEVTSKIMNDYNKRQELINQIVSVCVQYNLDGINVDFENMKQEDKDLYSRFIIELTPRLKSMGMVV